MDKTVIFAVAGSGKTTHIVDSLSSDKRTLIVTYTVNNYNNLLVKIMEKFNGSWPDNIFIMRYFQFLYSFCYKPFLADRVKAKGITFETNPQQRLSQSKAAYYMTSNRYLYSNRLALLVGKMGVLNDINDRIKTYFDEFIIDEVQDIAGRDFTLLESLMETHVNMLFVGDFFSTYI
ncbi:MAG: AAA family ATPase [Lachnospiraceae bacterium]|nr:AAA family ATPase [Lachnospiraceae bacterium]